MNLNLGVDVGGTHVKFALVTRRGRVRDRGIVDTMAERGAPDAFRRVRSASASLLRSGDRIDGVGLGCAGLIDPRSARLLDSPNLRAWEGTALRSAARRIFGVPATVDNDANCAAWGEYRHFGRRDDPLILITLGTGVGGGIVCNGRVVRGTSGYAGEVGHATVFPAGRRCRCGKRGCLEAYAGAWAWIKRAREAMAERPGGWMELALARIDERLTPRLIARAARKRDPAARAVVTEAAEALGIAVASLIDTLNPSRVAVGGGMAAAWDMIGVGVRRQVRFRTFAPAARCATIEPAVLGNDAAVVGAAWMAMEAASGTR